MPTRGSHAASSKRTASTARTVKSGDPIREKLGDIVQSSAFQSLVTAVVDPAAPAKRMSSSGYLGFDSVLLSEGTERAWVDAIMEKFRSHLTRVAHAYSEAGVAAPSVDTLVELAASVIPAAVRNPLDVEIGPFFDTAGVQAFLDVTKQGVEKRRAKHTIMALRTADGRWVYPVWQFEDRQVIPALVPAFQAFADSPPWSAALWFVTENPDLDGATPLGWLGDGLPTEHVLASAQATAREWR